MKFLMFILLALPFTCSAISGADDLDRSPKSFLTPHGKGVFIDLKEATYNIDYDLKVKKAEVTAKLEFITEEEGLPLFDLIPGPKSLSLDGQPVGQELVESPDEVTRFRIVLKNILPGRHVLEVKYPHQEEFAQYIGGGVVDAIIIDDYADRVFLEYFFPANLEYDQVKMSFHYTFKGATKEQRFYTNGTVTKHSLESYRIVFPETYNCSSIFMTTAPQGVMKELGFSYNSLPIVIFTDDHSIDLEPAKKETLRVLADLEKDFGPFPHSSFTLEYFGEGEGGMEYAGAAQSSLDSIDHEIIHSYFARGIMPANGNAGWFDEAIANWYESGYPTSSRFPMAANYASHSPYLRLTPIEGDMGIGFMSYLDHRFHSKGGLKPFLKHLVETRAFQPYTTEDVIKLMSDFYGEDVSTDFYSYAYQRASNLTILGKKGKNDPKSRLENLP